MTATITTTDQLDTLPAGTVITRFNGNGNPIAAIKLFPSTWDITDSRVPIQQDDEPDWVGADIMVRKVDYLTMARHVDDCRAELAEVRAQLAAALRAETEAIDALAAFIADSDKAVAA